jgi:hypothetical protein
MRDCSRHTRLRRVALALDASVFCGLPAGAQAVEYHNHVRFCVHLLRSSPSPSSVSMYTSEVPNSYRLLLHILVILLCPSLLQDPILHGMNVFLRVPGYFAAQPAVALVRTPRTDRKLGVR